jgi:hypothetical protein
MYNGESLLVTGGTGIFGELPIPSEQEYSGRTGCGILRPFAALRAGSYRSSLRPGGCTIMPLGTLSGESFF